jgi:hypothetical protein
MLSLDDLPSFRFTAKLGAASLEKHSADAVPTDADAGVR